jgi:hypothetical protein
MTVVRGLTTSHMSLHHTSIQQQLAAAHLSGIRRSMSAQLGLPLGTMGLRADWAGRLPRWGARSHIHEAKAAIAAEMWGRDRPVTSKELQKNLGRAWSLEAIEYHLSTLVKTGVVEIVFGPELHFSLTESGEGFARERCR